jgi:flagellar biosynthesis protein FlhB
MLMIKLAFADPADNKTETATKTRLRKEDMSGRLKENDPRPS